MRIATYHRDQSGGSEISWITLFSLAFYSIAFYTSMEWLYFATKPSLMSGMNAWGIIKIWLQTNFVVFLATFCILALLFFCDRVIAVFSVRQIIKWIAGFIPVFFIGITILLLVDNFTYTLFRIGIVSASGIFRGILRSMFLDPVISRLPKTLSLPSAESQKFKEITSTIGFRFLY